MRLFTGCFILLMVINFTACSKNSSPTPPPATTDSIYFPPVNSNAWQTVSPASLGWNTDNLNTLADFLQTNNTKAFIILKNGKIAYEKYFGSFTIDSNWYWASAGKTLTAFLVGIAQQENLIDINKPTSIYIGKGWTSEPVEKENLITIKNQLTMTTGLDDGVDDQDCTLPECLVYKADAGTRWAYHNAAYTILDEVVTNASGVNYNTFFQQQLGDKIGMNGVWIKTLNSNNIFYSNPRSMARFGLLMLNKGKWNGNDILNDADYFNSQVNTSQNYNLSYGYLTWLNGKSSYMVPGSQLVLPGFLIPNAPAEMYAALGKNDQKIYVLPSKQMVIIRMGNSAGGFSPALSGFDNELWQKLDAIFKF